MVRVRVEWTGQHQRAALVEGSTDNGNERLVQDLGWVVTAHLEDVPVEYRDHPAVLRWFAERDDGIHTVADHELAVVRADLMDALLAAERGLVEDLVYDFVTRHGVPAFIERVLTPLLRDVGDGWLHGGMTVVDEHLATSGLRDALRAIRGPTPPMRVRRADALDILVYDPPGETHSLGVEVLDMRLTDAGHRTVALVGGAPVGDIVERARHLHPRLVLCSVTQSTSIPAAISSAAAVAGKLPGADVVLGGAGVDHVPHGVPPGVHVVVDATTTDAVLIADAIAEQGACPIYAA